MSVKHPESGKQVLQEIRQAMGACMQCGTCSASCPNVQSMDMTPRRMWRLVILGRYDDVLASKTFWYCSSCYTCTLRCPRGLPLTEAIYALKRYAASQKSRDSAFYRAFMDNVRKYGRVQEGLLMTNYMLEMKSPSLAMSFAPIGLKLLKKGKLHPPSGKHRGVLDEVLGAVNKAEARKGEQS